MSMENSLPIQDSFYASPYYSGKYSSYFPVYQELFEKYVGKPVTFVEVGVLNGGSLFMWRNFLGAQARVIGVEFNPGASRWRDHGFEIFIGDQSDEAFWHSFFQIVGPVDVLLDDGGHENLQQITTVASSLNHIRDGGLIVVEDTHTSYWRRFGNPSRKSFINFSKHSIDKVNARSPSIAIGPSRLGKSVASVRFFESMVAFYIDRNQCAAPVALTNGGASVNAENYFIHDRPMMRKLTAAGARTRDALRMERSRLGRRMIGLVGDAVSGLDARRQTSRTRKLFTE